MQRGIQNTALILLGVSQALHPIVYAADDTGEPRAELTLARALALAEERHPELGAIRTEAQASDGRVARAAARQNPTVSFEAENFGGKGEQRRFNAAEYTTQIEQTIELGGKRGARVQVASTERQLAGFDLVSARLDVRAETTRRFVGVLGAQATVDLAKESVALAEVIVKAAATRVEAGKVPPMELEKARVLLAQKNIALDQARRSLESARIQLAAQWGNFRPVFESAAGDLLDVPSVPPLAGLMSRLPDNPDVGRWIVEIERARAVLAQEKAVRVPDLTVTAGVRYSGEADADTFVAGVALPLPLFDRNQGGVREARSLLAKAERQRRAAEIRAAADLATAHQSLAAAANRASALGTDVLPRVKAVFDAVQSGYAQGKYTYMEVLDAQGTLFESRAEQIEALVSAHTALADLERIAGGPLRLQKKD